MVACAKRPCLAMLDTLYALKDKRRIHTTKGKIITHHIGGLQFAYATANVIQLTTALIQMIKVKRGRKPVFPHHCNRQPGLNGATGTETVADITLHGAKGYRASHDLCSCLRLGNIAQNSGGTMTLYIVNLFVI